jgi:hypothetical protein
VSLHDYINVASAFALMGAVWWLDNNHPRAARVLTVVLAASCAWAFLITEGFIK